MTCAHSISSPEQGGGCSPISSSAITPSAPSSGIPTAARSCANDATKDGSPACMCTRETFGCSIHPSGRDEWIAFMRDSLARILAPLVEARESMEKTADFTAKSCECMTWFDRATSSWRTPQQSLLEGLDRYSETWPRAGFMRDGRCWPLRTWVRPVSVSGGGALHHVPSAKANDAEKRGRIAADPRNGLAAWVLHAKIPSAKARDWRASGGSRRNSPDLPTVIGGAMNPDWEEWLQGFPIGYTASKHWETRKSRSRPRRRGGCSEGHSA